MLQTLNNSLATSYILISLVTLIGLLVGRFLNVVIYHLPLMMQRNWRKECIDYLQIEVDETECSKPFNIALPLSSCSQCNTAIKLHQNIPIISYIFLKGRCASCNKSIAIRYPLIEALTAISSAIVAYHFGDTTQTLFALLLTWSLIALSFIDLDHQLLPDNITLPLLWLGLFLSLFEIYTSSQASIIGAIGGYGILWTVYQTLKLATGKEGMGYGDFKLQAALGAWLGWQYLAVIILLSSMVGAIISIILIVFTKQHRNTPIPFGPYLASAGWIALLWGNDLNQLYLNYAGL